jgi:hypothetical protein
MITLVKPPSDAARASYCEIYNEALYDLVRWSRQPLAVRWEPARGFHVPDLAVRDCAGMADMLGVRARMRTPAAPGCALRVLLWMQ